MSVFDEENEISFYEGVPDNIRIKYNEWRSLSKGLREKLLSKGLPTRAAFEITPLCNLGCKMCFIRLEKDKMDSLGKLMTASQWTKIAKESAETGILFLIITGGEPFTHPEFIDIYTNISKLGFIVTLYTNAVMLNDKIIETLKKYPPHFLYITMYGSSKDTYEKVCGNGKAYDSVVNNIKILKDILKDIPIELRTTLVKDNINDAGELLEFAKQMKMKTSFSIGKLKPIRGAEYRSIDNIRFSPEESLEIQKTFLELIKNEKIYDRYKKIIEADEKILLGNDTHDINIANETRNLTCGAAKDTYTISWNGKMLPCQIFSYPYTLPLNVGLKNAWDELKNIRDTIKKPDRCIDCKYRKYCGECAAKIQAESGTYINGEPYSCIQQCIK